MPLLCCRIMHDANQNNVPHRLHVAKCCSSIVYLGSGLCLHRHAVFVAAATSDKDLKQKKGEFTDEGVFAQKDEKASNPSFDDVRFFPFQVLCTGLFSCLS